MFKHLYSQANLQDMTDNSENKQEELQHKYVLYQLLQNRIEELKQQVEMLQQKNMEMETTKFALSEINSMKEGNDVLVPLGSGCYVYGKASNNKKILVDIGAGVMTNKAPEEAQALVEEKREEIEKLVLNLQSELMDAVNKINEIGPELQKAAEEQQGN